MRPKESTRSDRALVGPDLPRPMPFSPAIWKPLLPRCLSICFMLYTYTDARSKDGGFSRYIKIKKKVKSGEKPFGAYCYLYTSGGSTTLKIAYALHTSEPDSIVPNC